MMKKTTFGAVLAFLFAAAGALTAAAQEKFAAARAGADGMQDELEFDKV